VYMKAYEDYRGKNKRDSMNYRQLGFGIKKEGKAAYKSKSGVQESRRKPVLKGPAWVVHRTRQGEQSVRTALNGGVAASSLVWVLSVRTID